MPTDIAITPVSRSRLPDFDLETTPFGTVFSDHMFTMDYADGRWRDPAIVPYGPITLEPGVMTLHYAQAVFEGLKAFRGDDGAIRIFRPDMNGRRLVESCRRLCIPPVEPDDFVAAVRALVEVDRAWVPAEPGTALYIRPILFSAEAHLSVRPSAAYRFIVMTCPVGAYFAPGAAGLALKVETRYARTAPAGGLGECKTAANYCGTLLAGQQAQAEGYDQVLWLDGGSHRIVEEAGLMNVFFRIGGRVVTPDLSGAILPGVTRASAIALMRERGVEVEERPIAIDEVVAALAGGSMEEIFVTGTAAVVTPVARLGYDGADLAPAHVPGPLARELYDAITGIQYGRAEDRHGWNLVLDGAPNRAATIRAAAG